MKRSVEDSRSKLVKRLEAAGQYRDMPVVRMYGILMIKKTSMGLRLVLPPALWPVVFNESHESIWSGHLRDLHTLPRLTRLYWWPQMARTVQNWVRCCQDCGSRKVRPREVIPPLRSLRGGDVEDRWALDVAGPFPPSKKGFTYVIAAMEYVTRCAVAVPVNNHKAVNIANFFVKNVIMWFGAFCELQTDNATEMISQSTKIQV